MKFLKPVTGVKSFSRYLAGFSTGQIEKDSRNLFRHREGQRVFVRIGLGAHFCPGAAGVHGIDPDVPLFHLIRQDLSKPLNSELGSGIGSPSRLPDTPYT